MNTNTHHSAEKTPTEKQGKDSKFSDNNSVSNPSRLRTELIRLGLFVALCALGAYLIQTVAQTPYNNAVIFIILLATLYLFTFIERLFKKQNKAHRFDRILREVLEGSRGARLVTDPANATIYSNQNFDDLIESTGQEGVQGIMSVFAGNSETETRIASLIDEAHRGAASSIQIPLQGPEKISYYDITAQPVPGWAGYIHWRIDDITNDQLRRYALQDEREKLIDFTDNAPVGFFSADENGQFVFANATFARWLGVDSDEMLHKVKLHDLLSKAPQDAAPYDIVEHGGARQVGEVKFKSSNGEVILASVNQTVVRYDDGSVRTRAVVNDLRAEHEMRKALEDSEDRLRQSQKMQAVGQLAGGVAHDFNNLLTAIIGFCDLLLLRHRPGDPSFQDIIQIQQNSNRAANLVRQLLAFSRQQTLTPEVQDITDILTEVSHLIRRLIGANVEFDISHAADLPLVKVDANQMEQVFMNLSVNARDAMEKNGGGVLSIQTSLEETRSERVFGEDLMPAGKWIKITVSDTGEGIPDEIMPRIFDPFFTTKDIGEGTGLGLSTVYGIIRQSNGFLEVKSVKDKGTKFVIYLPEATENDLSESEARQAEEESKKAATPKQTDLTGTACILLVEDEDPVRAFSTRALKNKGYDVLEANGGAQALNVINENKDKTIDLIITDVMMPDMDGPTLVKEIRALAPKQKIIFVSGYTEEKLKEHMGENIWFLGKPFTLKQLAEKVKDVLGQ